MSTENKILFAVLGLVVLSILFYQHLESNNPSGISPLLLEVANTPELRTQGLTGHRSLDPHSGMVFVFDQPDIQCFWAKDMLFDVDVSFLGPDGTIVDTETMKAGDPSPHCSSVPVDKVLETNVGYFASSK